MTDPFEVVISKIVSGLELPWSWKAQPLSRLWYDVVDVRLLERSTLSNTDAELSRELVV